MALFAGSRRLSAMPHRSDAAYRLKPGMPTLLPAPEAGGVSVEPVTIGPSTASRHPGQGRRVATGMRLRRDRCQQPRTGKTLLPARPRIALPAVAIATSPRHQELLHLVLLPRLGCSRSKFLVAHEL